MIFLLFCRSPLVYFAFFLERGTECASVRCDSACNHHRGSTRTHQRLHARINQRTRARTNACAHARTRSSHSALLRRCWRQQQRHRQQQPPLPAAKRARRIRSSPEFTRVSRWYTRFEFYFDFDFGLLASVVAVGSRYLHFVPSSSLCISRIASLHQVTARARSAL